jgi:hypothetical protein
MAGIISQPRETDNQTKGEFQPRLPKIRYYNFDHTWHGRNFRRTGINPLLSAWKRFALVCQPGLPDFQVLRQGFSPPNPCRKKKRSLCPCSIYHPPACQKQQLQTHFALFASKTHPMNLTTRPLSLYHSLRLGTASPKYDDSNSESLCETCLVVFGGDVRRTEGAAKGGNHVP